MPEALWLKLLPTHIWHLVNFNRETDDN